MRIAIIGDTHLGDSSTSPQYAFLTRALREIRQAGVHTLLHVGDVTAFGEYRALCRYLELLCGLDHHWVLGNSDVRDKTTEKGILSHAKDPDLTIEGRRLVGIHTPYGEISHADRTRLEGLADGDIVFFHHYIRSFKSDSRGFLEDLLTRKRLTVIHGHSHRATDEIVGQSRVIGVRALDPDKAIGEYPTITYMNITPTETDIREAYLGIDREVAADVRAHMGLSCVDNRRDVAFAAERGVRYIELRFNGREPLPGKELTPLLAEWRARTGGYLSIHMPTLTWKNGMPSGRERWQEALHLAVTLGADSLTIHPPTVHVRDMTPGSEAFEALLPYYVEAVRLVGRHVRVGIENLHMNRGETTADRHFGYTPEEVASFIDAINDRLGDPYRVGHVLDVGHARNNGIYASTDPVSRWYEKMGNRAVAYHIHQAVSTAEGMKNHCPLVDWFGPMISYVSFLYAWEVGMLNRVPVFLEVKGSEHFAASRNAFDRLFGFDDDIK